MRRIAVALVGALLVLGCSGRKPAATSTDEAGSWSSVGIGSVFVTRTITRLQQPFVHETETTTTQTLIARDAAEASIELVIAEGANTSTQDVKVPLRQAPPVAPHDGSTLNSSKGKCTVPAGSFDCTMTTHEIRQGDKVRSTETWLVARLPIPIKTVVTNENMTATTELMAVTLAR
jgi:hypothetical protein